MGGTTTLPEIGALDQVPLETVLKALSEQRVSGRIQVQAGGDEGVVELEHGRVAATRFREVQGDEALIRLISLTTGQYQIVRQHSAASDVGSDERLSGLIVEAQKRRARLEALGQAVGGPARVLQVDVRRLGQQLAHIPDEVNPVLNLCDGHRSVADLLRLSAFDEVTTLRILERLLLLGVVADHREEDGSAVVSAPASDAPVVEEAPPVEPAPVVEATAPAPVVEEAPPVEPAPVVEAAAPSPVVEEAPPVEPAPVVEAAAPGPVVEEAPPVEPAPVVEATPPSSTSEPPAVAAAVEPSNVDAPPAQAPATLATAPASEQIVLLTERVTTPPVDAASAVMDGAPASGSRVHAPPADLAGAAELRLHPATVDGTARPSVSAWQASGSGDSPVVARWTDFPPPAQARDGFDVFDGGRSSAGSIGAALGEQGVATDQAFHGWLDAEEASFFERAVSAPLDYETAGSHQRGRDVFPLVLGFTFAALVAVGLGLYLWRSQVPAPASGNVAIGEATLAEPPPPRIPTRPVIIPADDEAKVQSPYEAVADSARGVAPPRVDTVLGAETPVVTVLRDVEALGVGTAQPSTAVPVEQTPTARATNDDELTAGPGDDRAKPAPGATAATPAPASSPAAAATAADLATHPAATTSPVDAGKTFAELYAEGTRLLKRERYSQALAKFEAALVRDPGDARVYLSIGQIYFEFGNIPKALRHYRKAEALAPREPRVHLLMGLALHEAGKLQDARGHYQRYLDLAPDGSEAPAVRGILATLPR